MPDSVSALHRVRAEVGRVLTEFLARQRSVLPGAADELGPGLDALTALLAGGKRLRPAFCYWGWRGTGAADGPEVLTAAAALELLHAGALVHDDVMDGSDTRRGRPALHRQFASYHAERDWRGSAAAFGTGAAILLGDLLLCWTDELFAASGLAPDALARGRAVLDVMRGELMAGQYLDLTAQASGDDSVASALRVVAYKTAKYTIERPLHLGAALAGGAALADGGAALAGHGPALAGGGAAGVTAAYTGYGLPLGVAFQLRDDILGIFGDPARTGKPASDDLRAGKRTVLLAITRARAGPRQAAVIDRCLGDPDLDEAAAAEVRAVITSTGALAECEQLISRHLDQALSVLAAAPITAEARAALAELAVTATARHD
jgi:geranylgeranyl diphosphate synthase type I